MFEHKEQCRHFWMKCIEQHTFHRCSELKTQELKSKGNIANIFRGSFRGKPSDYMDGFNLYDMSYDVSGTLGREARTKVPTYHGGTNRFHDS